MVCFCYVGVFCGDLQAIKRKMIFLKMPRQCHYRPIFIFIFRLIFSLKPLSLWKQITRK